MIVTAVEFDISTRNMIKFEQKKTFFFRPSFFLFFIFSFRKFYVLFDEINIVGKKKFKWGQSTFQATSILFYFIDQKEENPLISQFNQNVHRLYE